MTSPFWSKAVASRRADPPCGIEDCPGVTSTVVSTVPALGPTVNKALEIAQSGVPGPVFVEVPVDVLYPESLIREWYQGSAASG